MEKIIQLFDEMEKAVKASLTYNPKTGFWYDNDDLDLYYTEEGISLIVYEDLKDSINIIFNNRC